ncbi:hypothetical protein Plim_3604 [Planctopirus limnophila DSM 3776]|uniref:Uncharacterized protein n=1 Tax=Planctopirus limnophila (strain ATCC 43296 / DSM 3776 / IFAM 1008 / Mu 290) TaxID=521674 RepID=D5SVQ7_PLAL2|nr:hypothetical protein [Planctopirus limnophila]ADG69417.1 hypothetical protein Plim_3604 [Planctopirus limnophila DSM 3776]
MRPVVDESMEANVPQPGNSGEKEQFCGSARFALAASDAGEIARTVAIAGGSAALVALLEILSSFHFGTWNAFFTAVFTVVIRLVQQWSTDTRRVTHPWRD